MVKVSANQSLDTKKTPKASEKLALDWVFTG